jgi:branched-chain amino acid transport system permease protein
LEYFLQQLINGVTLGSIYGLIAIGYTMVYGIIGMINFAHGDIFMVGTMICLVLVIIFLAVGLSVPVILLLLLIAAVLLTALYGWAVERIAYRPLRGSFRLAPLISAIGMSIFLQNYVQNAQGADKKSFPTLIPGNIRFFPDSSFPVILQYSQIAVMVMTVIVLVAFTYVVARTPLGRAQRACEQDLRMASLMGINVDRVISLTFVMGAALAAVAGIMHLVYYGVTDFYAGFVVGIKAFTAAVLGGIGSLPGAVIGGLTIGLIETFFAGYVSVDYKDVAAFSILTIVLIFLPSGLLGRPEVEKV